MDVNWHFVSSFCNCQRIRQNIVNVARELGFCLRKPYLRLFCHYSSLSKDGGRAQEVTCPKDCLSTAYDPHAQFRRPLPS